MLGFVTQAAGANGDDAAAELLAGIEGIRVQVYEDVEDSEAVVDFIDEAASRLESAGWQRAVYVQDDEDERVQMYLRFEAGEVSGMTVMIADGDEAVFINMAGTIDPATLGAVSRTMGFGGVLDAFGGGVIAVPQRTPAAPTPLNSDEDEDD